MGRFDREKNRDDQRHQQLGCFVLCSGEVEDGENVKIFFPLSDGRTIQFWGEVINHVFEIGFAVRFIELSKAQREFLEKFVDCASEEVAAEETYQNVVQAGRITAVNS